MAEARQEMVHQSSLVTPFVGGSAWFAMFCLEGRAIDYPNGDCWSGFPF